MISSLGVYFGPRFISIVEIKGKKVLRTVNINRLMLSTSELEDRVPEDIKLVALFKDELRKNKIEVKEATLSLSGKDLIIRNFEMPSLSPNELISAVNFEAKKYIPFKVEDLVSDFQAEYQRSNQKNLVLYVGIKKEILDKYVSIFKQLAIKINSIEYSAFSALRFLQFAGYASKGVIAIVSVDLQEEREANFTVLQNGFPLFSRDISLIGESEDFSDIQGAGTEGALEKLKTEIRISLDYYHRKSSTRKIERTLLVCDDAFRADLETFMKDLGHQTQFIEVIKYMSKESAFSLSFIKGYGSALYKTKKIPLKINLLRAKEKLRVAQEALIVPGLFSALSQLASGLRIDFKTVISSLLLCVLAFSWGIYRRIPIQRALNDIINNRPAISTVNPQSSYQELINVNTEYMGKIVVMDSLVKKDFYVTEILAAVPRLLPANVWLTNLQFTKREKEIGMAIGGLAFLGDAQKDIERVHVLLSNLKRDGIFNKYFKDIEIVSIDHHPTGEMTLTNFSISCKGEYLNKNKE